MKRGSQVTKSVAQLGHTVLSQRYCDFIEYTEILKMQYMKKGVRKRIRLELAALWIRGQK